MSIIPLFPLPFRPLPPALAAVTSAVNATLHNSARSARISENYGSPSLPSLSPRRHLECGGFVLCRLPGASRSRLHYYQTLRSSGATVGIHKVVTPASCVSSRPIASRAGSTFAATSGSISATSSDTNSAEFESGSTSAEVAAGMAAAADAKGRGGEGIAIVWLRSDLRVHDNEALLRAWQAAAIAVPVYCFDPRCFSTTHNFGFPKTAAQRARFLLESVADLRQRLQGMGSELVVRVGPPETVLPAMAAALNAHLVGPACCGGSGGNNRRGAQGGEEPQARTKQCDYNEGHRRTNGGSRKTRGRYCQRSPPEAGSDMGAAMYHVDDLPFAPANLPDIYTQFRKAVETKAKVRPPLAMPASLGPFLSAKAVHRIGGLGSLPSLADLGIDDPPPQVPLLWLCSLSTQGVCYPSGAGKQQHWLGWILRRLKKGRGNSSTGSGGGVCVAAGLDYGDPRGVLPFRGGETAALARVEEYVWQRDCIKEYKLTRNGMLGADYSTKLSPWLAHGCISARFIHSEVLRYEKERVANESTYWVLFELIWRDSSGFSPSSGPRRLQFNSRDWSTNRALFDAWREGRTGYPLVDANMRELAATGFMSNRGRQIVCSFLVRDMGMDWRMGAEWFESLLLDHDPASNYGNWTYGAGTVVLGVEWFESLLLDHDPASNYGNWTYGAGMALVQWVFVRCWYGVGTVFVRCWYGVGTVFVRCWYGVGTVFVRCCVGTVFVRCWYGVGTVLVRCWYGVGTVLVRCWYGVGTVFVRCWYGWYGVGTVLVRCLCGVGTVLVRCWYGVGTVFVRCWYGVGTVFVRCWYGWYGVGTVLVRCWYGVAMALVQCGDEAGMALVGWWNGGLYGVSHMW
ncbi:unnamed protein product [Closterium sp. Yama58-4]|nr:unnamed protein product [Closterium sp. Yama58-4]